MLMRCNRWCCREATPKESHVGSGTAAAAATATATATATPTLAAHNVPTSDSDSNSSSEPCTALDSYVNFAQGDRASYVCVQRGRKGRDRERERWVEYVRERESGAWGKGCIVSGTCCLSIKCDKWLGPQVEPKERINRPACLLSSPPLPGLPLSLSLQHLVPPCAPSPQRGMCV